MANKPISGLTSLAEAADIDQVLVVDVSDTSGAPFGTTKKADVDDLSPGLVSLVHVDGSRPVTGEQSVNGIILPNRTLPSTPAAAAGTKLASNSDDAYLLVPGETAMLVGRGRLGTVVLRENVGGDDYEWPDGWEPPSGLYNVVKYIGALDPNDALTLDPTTLPAGTHVEWAQPAAAAGTPTAITVRQGYVSATAASYPIAWSTFSTASTGNYLIALVRSSLTTTNPAPIFTDGGSGRTPALQKKVFTGTHTAWLYVLVSDGTETGFDPQGGTPANYEASAIVELEGVDTTTPWGTWDSDTTISTGTSHSGSDSTVTAGNAEDMVVFLGVFNNNVTSLDFTGDYDTVMGAAGVQGTAPSFKTFASNTRSFFGALKAGTGNPAALAATWTGSVGGVYAHGLLKSEVV